MARPPPAPPHLGWGPQFCRARRRGPTWLCRAAQSAGGSFAPPLLPASFRPFCRHSELATCIPSPCAGRPLACCTCLCPSEASVLGLHTNDFAAMHRRCRRRAAVHVCGPAGKVLTKNDPTRGCARRKGYSARQQQCWTSPCTGRKRGPAQARRDAAARDATWKQRRRDTRGSMMRHPAAEASAPLIAHPQSRNL